LVSDHQPDKEFHISHVDDKFQVKFDPSDHEFIYLYQNDKPVHMAQLKIEAPMAMVDMKEGDGKFIKGFTERTTEILEEIERANEQDDMLLEELGVIDAEGYIKAPVAMAGIMKDPLNNAENVLKSSPKKGGSIYGKQDEGGLI